MGLILQHITNPPPRPRELCCDIPEHVETVILKIMAKDPAELYADLLEVKLKL